MLCELRVKNLALIESLELSFEQDRHAGLVVMTGETGAGKSIMLRAIHLLSGKRASADWIRSGAETCEVEALFEIKEHHRRLLDQLDESGFGRDTSLIIKRVVSASGRSRFYVNGSLATAKVVTELTDEMLSVASQHDQQQLVHPGAHLDYIDTLGDLWQQRQKVGQLFRQWQEKKGALADLRRQEQEKEQRQDYLKFQLAEIAEAGVQPGEDEQLIAEKKRLKNGQALIHLSQESFHLLSGKLMDDMARLRQGLSQLAALDPGATKLAEDISGFTFLAEDYANELRLYRDGLETDPYRLEQVTGRLDLLQQLKRKYGDTLEAVLLYEEKGKQELEQLEHMDRELGQLQQQVDILEKELVQEATTLSEERRKIGMHLEKAMAMELASLAFDRAEVKVVWKDVEQVPQTLRASGWDRGEFFFSANPGEPERPLAKIASGGELSRLMLAMKCLLAKKDMVETVIFDEVDTGIGGEAAEAVARKIQELAGHHQVFCITHLPQIAARGTLHFQVSKTVDNGRTQTAVNRLSEDSRVQELVRMLAGESATQHTRAWAEQLLAKGGVAA